MIRKSNGVGLGKVEFSGCLATDVSRGVKAENLWESEAKPWNADDKAAGKRVI